MSVQRVDFETGDDSQLAVPLTSGIGASIQSSIVFEGSYALKLTSNPAAGETKLLQFATPSMAAYCRFRFYREDLGPTPSGASSGPVIAFYDASNTRVASYVLSYSGVAYSSGIKNDIAGTSGFVGLGVAAGAWFDLELGVLVGTTGRGQLYSGPSWTETAGFIISGNFGTNPISYVSAGSPFPASTPPYGYNNLYLDFIELNNEGFPHFGRLGFPSVGLKAGDGISISHQRRY